MNPNLTKQYNNITIYDLITKFHFKNLFEIPKITKIFLNIGFKNANVEKKKLINLIMLLKLITNQPPIVAKSTKNSILLKIKKHSIVGCTIILRKKNIHYFLENLLISNFNQIQFNLKIINIIDFQITNQNILNFINFKTEFFKFQNIPSIDISIHTNSTTNIQTQVLLNSLFLI